MTKVLVLLGLLVPVACSGSSAAKPDAPVISMFTMASPLPAGAMTATGSVTVTDPSGLVDLSANLTITGQGINTTLNIPIQGGSSSETMATAPLTLEYSTAFPAGTYQVTITLSESGVSSNSLTASVVVQ